MSRRRARETDERRFVVQSDSRAFVLFNDGNGIFIVRLGQHSQVFSPSVCMMYYYVGFPRPSQSGKFIALSLKIYPPIQGEGGGGVNEYRVYSLVIALATFSRPLLTHSSSLNGMHHSFACLVWQALPLPPPSPYPMWHFVRLPQGRVRNAWEDCEERGERVGWFWGSVLFAANGVEK